NSWHVAGWLGTGGADRRGIIVAPHPHGRARHVRTSESPVTVAPLLCCDRVTIASPTTSARRDTTVTLRALSRDASRRASYSDAELLASRHGVAAGIQVLSDPRRRTRGDPRGDAPARLHRGNGRRRPNLPHRDPAVRALRADSAPAHLH